ncbi:hypothetical protein [Deinococcus roseus]|uniref:Uncharacterized protein n=1 Tax=Deinococcus roseus TaxID=392414 RepID=A0ABQ2DHL1_9DEIO|nr:hypothetical protein [Deinococcus roseus]GGJ58341.1 hypothetical protein GCM10008938_50530 [Deinococcus roseus]
MHYSDVPEALWEYYLQISPGISVTAQQHLQNRYKLLPQTAPIYQGEYQRVHGHMQSIFGPLMKDVDLATEHVLWDLTDDGAANSVRMKVIEPQTGPDPVNQTLVTWGGSRRARWERLVQHLDLPFPTSFRLYRGVRLKQSFNPFPDLLNCWQQGRPSACQTHPLDSWTFDPQVAEAFVTTSQHPGSGVVLAADVVFESTLADVFVDDSYFLFPYHQQMECVVRHPANLQVIDPQDSYAIFKGHKYYIESLRPLTRMLRRESIIP